MDRHGNRTALVAYGSETGNAQELAEELGRVTRRLHFTTRVTDLDSLIVSDLLRHTIILIAISTTGQGDLPTNSQLFWRKLRSSKLAKGCLSRVCFASFGLGDSAYPQFNWAHRKFNNRLRQLGAQEVFERGEADESAPEGADGLFVPWYGQLRRRLVEQYPLQQGLEPISDEELLIPEWRLEQKRRGDFTNGWSDHGASPEMSDAQEQLSDWSKHDKLKNNDTQEELSDDTIPTPNSITATLSQNKRVTPPTHWQDVRHLDFILPHTPYNAGDVLTIYPKNFRSDVNHLIHLMNWSSIADKPIQFTPTYTSPTSAPPVLDSYSHITLRTLLTNHLDLLAIPRRSFFSFISHFTSNPDHRARLIEFTAPELLDEFYDYTTRPRRSILEVLQEFDSVKIPWEYAPSAFPTIRGRQFSIASGGNLKHTVTDDGTTATKVQLLVAIVKYRTVIKRIRRGLCTRYLAALQPGTRLNVRIGRGSGSGSMGVDPVEPAIMIGPGTGVAPLRAMVYERLANAGGGATRDGKDGGMAPQILFFGARNKSADFFFEDEWTQFGALPEHPAIIENTEDSRRANLKVITAFSRDSLDTTSTSTADPALRQEKALATKRKFYVQDAIRLHAREVKDFIVNQHAGVYVSGSSGKMPIAVKEAIVDAIADGAGDDDDGDKVMTREDAEAWVARMRKEGCWWEECW